MTLHWYNLRDREGERVAESETKIKKVYKKYTEISSTFISPTEEYNYQLIAIILNKFITIMFIITLERLREAFERTLRLEHVQFQPK